MLRRTTAHSCSVMVPVFPGCHQFLLQQFSAVAAPLVGVGSAWPMLSPLKAQGYQGSHRDCPTSNQALTLGGTTHAL